jgi:virginiamycin B lyase
MIAGDRRPLSSRGHRVLIAIAVTLAGALVGLAEIAPSRAGADAIATVTEYPVPPSIQGPCTVAADPASGDVYFSSAVGLTRSSIGSIGVLNPSTRAVRTIPLPSPLATPGGMAFGPDGDLYFSEYLAGNAIARLDPETDKIVEYPLPTPLSDPSSLVLGPDNAIWFIENLTQRLGRFDPATHAFTEYPLPSPGANLGLEIIERGAGDELLFSLPDTNQIGTFDVVTHEFETYTSPTPLSLPQGVAVADGAIWFTETLGQNLARIDPVTGKISEFSLSTVDLSDPTLLAPFPASMIEAADGDLYILNGTTEAGDSITRFDPVTHARTTIRTPTLASGPCDWDAASRSTLWFGELSGDKIASLSVGR